MGGSGTPEELIRQLDNTTKSWNCVGCGYFKIKQIK